MPTGDRAGAGGAPSGAAVLEVLRGMQAFQKASAVLRELEITHGRSWDDLKSAAEDHWSPKLEERLLAIYEELRLFGRKHIFLFQRNKQLKQSISDLQQIRPKGADAVSFPFPLGESFDDSSPRLVAVRQHGQSLVFVFESIRIVNREKQLDRQYLREDAPEEIRNSRDIRVFSETEEHAFDLVSIPLRSGPIEVSVDLYHYATEPNHMEARGRVIKAFRTVAAAHNIDADAWFSFPIPLTPAIHPIYRTKTEGRIVELAFMCPTETRRRERMASSQGEDLRREAYHRSGVRAIGGHAMIDIYRMAVEWSVDDDDERLENAHLLFPGTLGNLKGEPLIEVRLPRIAGRREHEHVMARLRNYVGDA